MTVTGYIFDNKTGGALPGATITEVDPDNGSSQGYAIADGAGHFTITDANLGDGLGFKLKVTNVGYSPVLVDPSIFLENGGVGLDQAAQVLETAVVTAQTKKKVSPVLLVGGGGLLFLLLASSKKKGRSVGAIDIDWQKIALAAGISIGAYFLVLRPILIKLGIIDGPKDATQQQTDQAQQASLDKAKQDAAAAGKPGATYADVAYAGWANDIYNEGIAGSTDADRIVGVVKNVKTEVDLYSLIKAFGQREVSTAFWSTCNFLGFRCPSLDLNSFLNQVLDGDQLQQINNYLSTQGINYSF